MKRWSVRKRDGAWCVFDHRGKLRYTAASWRMAITFALMCGQPLPPVGYGPWEAYFGGVDHRHPLVLQRPDVRRAIIGYARARLIKDGWCPILAQAFGIQVDG